jgi:cytochrome c peroxidase
MAAAKTTIARAALRERANAFFGSLPAEVPNPANPITPAKVELGRMLYYDARLSKNHDVACNTCYLLDRFGVDGEPTSVGHRGQRGDRNAPTVYNAALHFAQFWDGRAADVEEQAKGPVLNPVEMAMASEAATVAVLESIPGYAPLFAAAFPEDEQAITYENMARAIGAFERGLMTPAPFDAFLAGDDDALSETELAGLDAFISSGCIACHQGPAVGGLMYQKLGLIKPYPGEDPGRAAVTGNEADRQFFNGSLPARRLDRAPGGRHPHHGRPPAGRGNRCGTRGGDPSLPRLADGKGGPERDRATRAAAERPEHAGARSDLIAGIGLIAIPEGKPVRP